MADKEIQDDVLEFGDDALPELPGDNPFGEDTGKSRRWLLVGIGVVAITLVVVVVLKLTLGGDKAMDETGLIELPIEQGIGTDKMPPAPDDFAEQADKLVSDQPVGMPERVVEPKKEVVFDPDKPIVARPKPRPIAPGAKDAPKPARVAQTAPKTGTWSVQVGAYNSRADAEKARRQLSAAHKNLFSGRDFAILSAVVNGSTKYRLRVVNFKTSAEASAFQKSAKSDGVDGYVTK